MTRQPCRVTGCDRPTDAFVCRPCIRDLERRLAETGWLLMQLELVRARQVVYGTRYGGSSSGTPLVDRKSVV